MQIDIPLPCPICNGKMYCVSYESPFPILKKEVGNYVKNVIMKETLKILKIHYVVNNVINSFLNKF